MQRGYIYIVSRRYTIIGIRVIEVMEIMSEDTTIQQVTILFLRNKIIFWQRHGHVTSRSSECLRLISSNKYNKFLQRMAGSVQLISPVLLPILFGPLFQRSLFYSLFQYCFWLEIERLIALPQAHTGTSSPPRGISRAASQRIAF